MRFTVVSNPAMSSREHIGRSSSGRIRSPFSATMTLTRSSRGSRSRSSNSRAKRTSSSRFASITRLAWPIEVTPSSALPSAAP